MNLDSLLEMVSHRLLKTQNRPLNFTELLVLKGIWQSQTYQEIAEQGSYSPGYLTNVVAPELCRKLSDLIGQRVTKKNCKLLLEFYATNPTQTERTSSLKSLTNSIDSSYYPSGAVPLNSPFYIERLPMEAQVYDALKQPGVLVRIKAPQEMGKTSLLLRILDQANYLGYQTVSLNLEQIEQEILGDLNRFLRWLCANATRQLELQLKLDEYWDEDIGSKVSCTIYFRYLLEQCKTPLVLALDEVNQIFEHPQTAREFFPLLRSWYEEAKRLPIWQKLRLVVVHSTDIYVPLQLNQSPFNVGIPVQLDYFSLEQVKELARRYHLNWTTDQEAEQLMLLTSGHSFLVHLALYYVSRGEISLAQLLQTASTSNGIYSHHLQRHWATIQEHPALASALQQVVESSKPITLEPILAYKLSSMGLVKLSDNQLTPSCQLYQQYFKFNLNPTHSQVLYRNPV